MWKLEVDTCSWVLG